MSVNEPGTEDYNPFISALQQPSDVAVPSQGQRYAKLARKGLTLGVTDRDIQAESVGEHVAEFAGEIPTIVGASALATPAAGALLRGTRVAQSLNAARMVGATGVGAGVGSIRAAAEGENILEGAVKGAGEFAVGEGVFVYGGKLFRKVRGSKPKEISPDDLKPNERESVIEVISETPEVPTAAVERAQDLSNLPPKTLKSVMRDLGGGRLPGPLGPPEIAPGGPKTTADILRGMADDAIRTRTETPSAEAVDAAVVVKPNLPTLKPTPRIDYPSFGEQLQIPGSEDIRGPVQYSLFNIEKYGPNISAQARDLGTTSAERVPFQAFVQQVDPLWNPIKPMGPGLGPGDEATQAIRKGLAEKFPPNIISSAQKMSQEDFIKYAAEPGVAEIIEDAGTKPIPLWRAIQLSQGPETTVKDFSVTTGERPFFQEIFDESLGKKVLVPIDPRADQAIKALDLLPSPRQLGLQFEPEQLAFFNTPKGQDIIRKMDVHKLNEELLTTKLLTKSEDEVERIVMNATPINPTQPVIIKRTNNGVETAALRKKTGLTDGEVDRAVKESKAVATNNDLKLVQSQLAARLAEKCK